MGEKKVEEVVKEWSKENGIMDDVC